ncbi:MAG: 2,3-bisphosphoglycerate-independent phosphoglycerate mutase [Candidatus Fermentibacteraceae bacterium]|nr:2,3-bisphosphoglycerate-independent phosphoglycerate mutase [Candidatus Fermentibacteraceae bacterium]
MYKGLIERLALKNGSRILLAVLDGLGDIPIGELGGRTPLEAASTPNLDRLATGGALGMHVPIARGVTPGSGPAHLGLFGYDPVEYEVGRGVLSALGIGFPLRHGDLAARINFCTVDGAGVVTDRRAGRISTEKCRELVSLLGGIGIQGVEVHVMPVKEHRACVVFRNGDLSDDINDTDPGLVGERPVPVNGSGRSSEIVREFQEKSAGILAGHHPANFLLMRGFALHREFPTMEERFRLNAAAVALYPMYRGVASLVGMNVMACEPETLEGQVHAVELALRKGHDLVFLHHKPADSSGEDGNPAAKVSAIEDFDRVLPRFLELKPDVVAVTGDHSTPCPMKLHSWHPVPVLIHGGPQRTGYSSCFSEKQALSGSLGTFLSTDLMPLMMAAGGKLSKFGA